MPPKKPVRSRRAGRVCPAAALSPCRKGELAEIAFLGRATALGYIVNKPFGHAAPYDFLIERGGRALRIQVKSTWVRYKWTGYAVRVGHFDVRWGCTAYKRSEVDFIAAYVAPEDVWYVIPIRAIRGGNTISLFPHVAGSRARYERYREAWERLIG